MAFVVDAEVTGYLMMGALTPNCKKHSGTKATLLAGCVLDGVANI